MAQSNKGIIPIKSSRSRKFVAVEDIIDSELVNISRISLSVAEADLPVKARRVLAIKLLPGSAFLSVKKKCEMIGISRRYWYYLHGQQKFRDACAEYAKKFAPSAYLPEIVGTLVLKAKFGDVRADVKGS